MFSCVFRLTPRTLEKIYLKLQDEVFCSLVFAYLFMRHLSLLFVNSNILMPFISSLFCLQFQPTNGGRCKFLQSFVLSLSVLLSNTCCQMVRPFSYAQVCLNHVLLLSRYKSLSLYNIFGSCSFSLTQLF